MNKPKLPIGDFHPSPIMIVKIGPKLVAMNRATRRRNKIYGDSTIGALPVRKDNA